MPSSKRQNLKRYLRNEELSQNPSFTTKNNYHTYLINKFTDTTILHDIIDAVKSTKNFTIDTESDWKTNQPALIQVEIIAEHLSTVLLVEVCHLPHNKSSLIFWLIRAICKFIFQEKNTIYCWGNIIKELKDFLIYNLFTIEELNQVHIVNMQDEFKIWHYNQFGFYKTENNPWGLQAAIYDTYEEFLDKHERLNMWSRGLYRTNNYNRSKIESMIRYASYDCLAVTKLAYTTNLLS